MNQHYLYENGICVGISNDAAAIEEWKLVFGDVSVFSCDEVDEILNFEKEFLYAENCD